jgi:drug/metabolite transporter (DMT)-like permease
MYNYLQPLVASIVAILIGLDKFTIWKGLASIFIFFGVYLVTQSKSKSGTIGN